MGETVIDVSMEVWALQGLYDLDLSIDQLKELRSIADGTASALGNRDAPKASDQYFAKLKALRDALVKQDDDKIDSLRDEVDEIESNDDDLDVDDSVNISDAARTKVAAVVKLVSSSQVASYIAAYEDDAPDPVQSLLDAADDIRDSDDEDAKGVIADTSDEVGVLVAGIEKGKARGVHEKVKSFLQQARKMSDADFKEKHADLEKSAREIVGEIDGFAILRHWFQRDMAELLSNPQLINAIDARLKAPPPKDSDQ